MRYALSLLALGAIVGCSHSRPRTMPAPSPTGPHPSEIRAQDIERSPGSSIEELLAARVPGLTLVRAMDGRTVLHIRGVSPNAEDGEPLFVVNGVALGSSSSLGAINRYDIASVEVLKDPASTAMWGIRGSNGVIVIRTKGS
jgi:TonB-dependent SusC/RagA subfamily outer membrane receptor